MTYTEISKPSAPTYGSISTIGVQLEFQDGSSAVFQNGSLFQLNVALAAFSDVTRPAISSTIEYIYDEADNIILDEAGNGIYDESYYTDIYTLITKPNV